MDGDKVACITKQWTGLVKEAFTQADNFGVTCKCIDNKKSRIYGTSDIYISYKINKYIPLFVYPLPHPLPRADRERIGSGCGRGFLSL